MEETIDSIFCIRGEIPLVCKNPVFHEFQDETEIIILILRYFKTYLPVVMRNKLDCRNRPIKLDPKDIGVSLQNELGDYVVLLVPTDDNSSYRDDNFFQEDTEYIFQLQLQVAEEDSEGALENLIKLKSGVKSMLVNMDNNLGLNTVIDSFSFEGPYGVESSTKLIRQGTYTFSVTDNRFKHDG